MSFIDLILSSAPAWLKGTVGTAYLSTFGTVLNDLGLQLKDGIKARFPNEAPEDALFYIAKDRLLQRGILEPATNFRPRLRAAVDTNKTRGNAHTLLKQLAAYFDGTGEPELRLVSNDASWHEYDWNTGLVTKTIVGDNWNWDDLDRKHRGWVIIDGSTLDWDPMIVGDGSLFGEDVVLGSTATPQEVEDIRSIVQAWKPKHVYAVRIIVTFVSGLFEVSDTSPPNPDGEYGDPGNYDEDATYWLSGGKDASY